MLVLTSVPSGMPPTANTPLPKNDHTSLVHPNRDTWASEDRYSRVTVRKVSCQNRYGLRKPSVCSHFQVGPHALSLRSHLGPGSGSGHTPTSTPFPIGQTKSTGPSRANNRNWCGEATCERAHGSKNATLIGSERYRSPTASV